MNNYAEVLDILPIIRIWMGFGQALAMDKDKLAKPNSPVQGKADG